MRLPVVILLSISLLPFMAEIALAQDSFVGYNTVQCDGTKIQKRRTINFISADTCEDDSVNKVTKVEYIGGSTITGSDTQVMFFDGDDTPAGNANLTFSKANPSLVIGSTSGSFIRADLSWAALEITADTDVASAATLLLTSTDGIESDILFASSNGTIGSPTASVDTDMLGLIQFNGHQGTLSRPAAGIEVYVDGDPTGGLPGNVPGKLVLLTAPESAASVGIPRLTIRANGNFEYNDGTNASITETYVLSGATDPVWTVENNSMDLTAGVLKQGGIDVCLENGTNCEAVSGSFGITIDGGGSAITTGVKGYIEVPYAMTIDQVTFICDQSGSIVVDVWKDTYANYPPTDADTITASAPPTITTATKSQDTTLTGWTTSVTSEDIFGFNVDSVTSMQRCTLVLSGDR
jgi:hypothetical protein